MMRTANAAAQLVQLGEAKMVGAFDDDGVGGGNVDPGFDDGGAHQHIEALVMEVIHHPLQFALPHLTVTDGDPRLRHQLRQLVGGFLDVFDVIKQIVDLAAAQRFRAGSPRAPPGRRIRERRSSPPGGAPAAWR